MNVLKYVLVSVLTPEMETLQRLETLTAVELETCESAAIGKKKSRSVIWCVNLFNCQSKKKKKL